MKTVFAILLVAVFVATTSAFGVHTPVNVSPSTSNGAGMTMRARECDLLGKRPNRQARAISFSHKRNKKVQHVNLQKRRFFSDDLGRVVRLRLSTKGLKTVEKYGGIDAAAKKFGLNLTKF